MADKPVVFITGASSGIGAATAREFARRGYCVAGTARDKTRLDDLRTDIPDLLPLSVDVQDADAVQAAVDATVQHFGRLDVLVANAGVGHRGGVVDSAWADVETLLRTNIDGVLHTIRAGVPAMRTGGGGHIVTVSSIVFNMVVPYAAYYAASKSFTSSLARSLRLELADDNIHVTDMIVGRTNTNFNRNRLGGTRTGGSIPSMTPEQVAQGIAQAVASKKRVAALRWIDRLIVLANVLVPSVVGRIAKRQYK